MSKRIISHPGRAKPSRRPRRRATLPPLRTTTLIHKAMAGSKRSRVKAKAAEIIDSLSPTQSPPTVEDDDLLDDLLAQIDNNPSSSPEAIKVLKEVDANQSKSTSPPLIGKPGKKKDPKAKFQERQVRSSSSML